MSSAGCWSLSQLLLGGGGVHPGRINTHKGAIENLRSSCESIILDCMKKPEKAHNAPGEHENSTQRGSSWDSQQGLLTERQKLLHHGAVHTPETLSSNMLIK